MGPLLRNQILYCYIFLTSPVKVSRPLKKDSDNILKEDPSFRLVKKIIASSLAQNTCRCNKNVIIIKGQLMLL